MSTVGSGNGAECPCGRCTADTFKNGVEQWASDKSEFDDSSGALQKRDTIVGLLRAKGTHRPSVDSVSFANFGQYPDSLQV